MPNSDEDLGVQQTLFENGSKRILRLESTRKNLMEHSPDTGILSN